MEYPTGRLTVQTNLPCGVYSLTQLPLISEMRTLPSASGVSPFGEPRELGGLCTQFPVVPIWEAIEPLGLMNKTRQFSASATVICPFLRRYASSGVWRYPGSDPGWRACP